ncbi:hypothetical protein KFK09_027763 [Dendrobium nobile]|uniref:Uncharacterized protein n=1 Tax=Dendrobium nobile TaxID=94219 RepID=A0A8T3A1L1_DENNO|nr:hypothetical protein KFK09_027763 [Dendrobium nobile]
MWPVQIRLRTNQDTARNNFPSLERQFHLCRLQLFIKYMLAGEGFRALTCIGNKASQSSSLALETKQPNHLPAQLRSDPYNPT